MKIEIKFILEKVSIILQEISIVSKQNPDQSARNLQPSIRMKKPLKTEISEEDNISGFHRSSHVNLNQLEIKEIIDVGLAGLKGKAETISG
jgi:hypothetical protein